MKRRDFLQLTGAALAASAAAPLLSWADARSPTPRPARLPPLDAAGYRAARRFAKLPFGRIAYVERGAGAAALFLHGAPLNGFQWRGALERLSAHRRCIALDFMGLGYSEVPEGQSIAAGAQATMLEALMDALGVAKADLVASDSGGAVAQLFLLRYPERVRSLLLTNCDVEPDSPPKGVQPVIEMARAGTLADATAKWLSDKALARSTFGAAVFHDPARFADETIEYYVQPLVSSPLRRRQYHQFHLALAPNPLEGIEAQLRRSTVPVRIVWGASDTIFSLADADYLDRTFPRSQGIRRVPEGKLFFQEEFPDVIAEEARRLWRVAGP
ncbi:alpha/beta hydrolase [Aggregicoccus sp. 17bor-14]|uniref:alpha/beta fold hydrolase n=1 Tax=Myxococcaceae TaxID=31 RepID=UPI00129CFAF5|nr:MULTISPECIES: alpha/beta hydrolase [Myxococcaceae]MBF5044632.1 alpha/beta hydrolase [Simulacricoccus sp. 17bor-14]MRI90376.1 alpha/beta hydrolase [Aggregicoccus sp. 17bor-14]